MSRNSKSKAKRSSKVARRKKAPAARTRDAIVPATESWFRNSGAPPTAEADIGSPLPSGASGQPSTIEHRLIAPEVRTETATELLRNTSLQTPGVLVYGLLHLRTKAMLAAASKTGKTWVTMDLAAAVATGRSFFGMRCEQGAVLFVNCEIEQAFFRLRLQTILTRRGIAELDNLHFLHLRGIEIVFEALVDLIIEKARGHRFSLIIIDPIYMVTGGKSDGSALAVATICAGLDRIIRATGATVLISHHYTKASHRNQTALQRIGGSGAWSRNVDSIITLDAHPELQDHFVVGATLRNFPPLFPFVVERVAGLFELRDGINPPLQNERRQVTDRGLLQLLGNQQLTTAEWLALAEPHGIPPSTFYRIVRNLEEAQRIQHDTLADRWHLFQPEPPPGAHAQENERSSEMARMFMTGEADAGEPTTPGTSDGRNGTSEKIETAENTVGSGQVEWDGGQPDSHFSHDSQLDTVETSTSEALANPAVHDNDPKAATEIPDEFKSVDPRTD